ncbi:MAG: LLM class flavin-dependent oxidoreductase [Nitrospinota bacterium]
MQFGIRIPSIAWPKLTHERAGGLRDYVQRCEDLGFDACWVIDHYLKTPLIYAVSWLEPMTTLAFVAGCTKTIKIGTAILVLPFRNPVLLAKEVATLDYLSGGRYVFGVGAGWDPKEYETLHVKISERGRRTDEVLAAARKLLTEGRVSFQGKFYSFEDVDFDPLPPKMPEVWVAGGAATHAPGAPESNVIQPTVLRRILQADAWIVRSSGSGAEDIREDYEIVKQYLRDNGRDPGTLKYVASQFLHLVEDSSREKCLGTQKNRFQVMMGKHRGLDHLMASYLFGTIEDVYKRIDQYVELGTQYMILNPITDEIDQLDLIKKHIVEKYADK